VLRVELAGKRLLLTGDIGLRAEAGLRASNQDLRADLLKVAHHGSRSSSTPAFLAEVRPELALVSAPCSVRAALPTVAALERLRAVDASPWWTGRHGAVFVSLSSDGAPMAVWSWLAHSRSGCSGRLSRAEAKG
jgi:competence protein ComEC